MTYKIEGLNGFHDAQTAISQAVGTGPDGDFAAEYDRQGNLVSLEPLSTRTTPALDSYIYHAGLLHLSPPMTVETIDSGKALARAYADYQANPPEHPDFPL